MTSPLPKNTLDSVRFSHELTKHYYNFSTVDFTTLNNARRCLRYCYYRNHRGIIPVAANDSAARFGELIHVGLNIIWRDRNLASAIIEFTRMYDIEGDPKRTVERGIGLLKHYWETRRHSILGMKCLQVERKFSTPCGAFTYAGRSDLILEDPATGLITAFDHKTTSWALSALELAYELSPQFLGYWEDLRKEFGERLRPEFWVDLLVINPKNDDFQLHPVTITERLLTEFHSEMNFTYKTIQHCIKEGIWPKSAPNACVAFNRICEYHHLCTARTAELEERFIELEFQLSPWEDTLEE